MGGNLGSTGTANTTSVVLLLVLFAVVVGGLVYMKMNKGKGGPNPNESAVTTYRSTDTNWKKYNFDAVYPYPEPPPRTPALNVFFLGDSYTLTNNMPALLMAVAASDQVAPVNIRASVFGEGSATLSDIWEEGSALKFLNQHKWDYVVLQESGLMSVSVKGMVQMNEAMMKWGTAIKRAEAKPMVFVTWARKAGSAWYTDKKKYAALNLGSAESMQDKVDTANNNAAWDIGASIVPAGDYYAACSGVPGMPDLYHSDGSQPSLAGDYLVALLFYRALTNHDARNVTYVPPGLDPDAANMLRQCASFG
jgi:hypothetical protein